MTKKRFVKIDVRENGRKGGNARALKLSAAKRKAIARKGGLARAKNRRENRGAE